MRLSVVICLVTALLVTSTSMAGTIGLYADQGVVCNLADDVPGLMTINVVLKTTIGASAAAYAAPVPACMTGATWLSDTVTFFQFGNSQIGVMVPFGTCLTGTILFHQINIFVHGTSETCCSYPVLPNPDEGGVVIGDCSNGVVPVIGEVSVVNGDATCPCPMTVPVDRTTWGKVKSLYRE